MNGKYLLLKVIGLAFVALSVVNCSKSGGGSTPAAAPTTCPAGQTLTATGCIVTGQYCPVGQTSTVGGCLPTCGSGLVYYQNQCVSVAQVPPGTGTGGVGQACGVGQLNSQYGCQPQCGTNAVIYNGQCVQVTSGGTQYPPSQQGDICSGRCGAGAVETFSGCMPQYSCGPCYGYNNGWCHKGVNAEAYYGY